MIKKKLARWGFWTALIVLVVIPWTLGMARMFTVGRRPQTVSADTTATRPIQTTEAAATATAFASEYLTFQPGDQAFLAARAERLKAFAAVADPYAGLIPAKEGQAQWVVAARPYSAVATVSDGTRGVITVQATVRTTNGGPRNVYLAVPVATDGAGRWTVTDLPRFVSGPTPAQVAPQQAEGEALDDKDGSLRALLTGFIKAYTTGAPAELAVYMTPGVEAPHGLAGTMRAQFREINQVQITSPAAGQARAEIVATLIDLDSGAAYRQLFRLELTQAGGRWSVARVD